MKLLLATSNRGKVRDLEKLLDGDSFEVLSLADFPDLTEIVEDGRTFLENARKKAWEIYKATGLPTLADDSGLEVEALDDAPGVFSARYAGEPANDMKNVRKLLEELEANDTQESRKARFVCTLVFVADDDCEIRTTGACEGVLAKEPKGENGFGYDPIFIHPAFGGRTMAEISRDEKNSVSHRGAAFRAMKKELIRFSKRDLGDDS